MHLPLYAFMFIGMLAGGEDTETLSKILLLATAVLTALMMPVCLLNIVVSFKSTIKDGIDPSRATMVAKLCLIPWYALNFLIGAVFVGIMFNPFMMIGIPIVLAIFIPTTYFLMFSTSFGDIAYFVYNAKKNGRLTPAIIVGVVFLFIFCLDVIGAIILFRISKKTAEQTQTIAPNQD